MGTFQICLIEGLHMNKKEVTEIKKQLTPNNCAITRICGCYVDGEKEKKASFKDAFHATWNVRVEIPKPGKSERKDSNLRLGHKPLLYL